MRGRRDDTPVSGGRVPREPAPLPARLAWLPRAWPLWAATMALVFVAGQWAQFDNLATVCAPGAPCERYRLSRSGAAALAEAGISPVGYAWLLVAGAAVILLGLLAVSALIIRRAGHQLLPVLVAWAFPATGAVFYLQPEVAGQAGPIAPLVVVAFVVNYCTLAPILALFPDGRFVPGWTRWLVVAATPVSVVSTGYLLAGRPTPAPFEPLNAVFDLGGAAVLAAAQVYRYLRVSGPAERRQTRWVLAGFVGVPVAAALVIGGGQARGDQLTPLGEAIVTIPALTVFGALAVAVAWSGLWDIDRLLTRALAYAIVSLVLAGTYTVVVLGAAAVLGEDQPALAVAAATLAAVAAFGPVHRRVRAAVDRRFNRRRYDAARTIGSFTDTLRQQIDLDALARELHTVVDRTMQPTHTRLWLRGGPGGAP